MMLHLTRWRAVLVALTVSLAVAPAVVGCGGPRIDAPEGYAEVESRIFRQRLMAPDGTVIAVRRFDNPDEKAGLKYWADALEIRKTQHEGMTLAGREDITTDGGLAGVLFEFEVGEAPGQMRYLVALFVIGDGIHTVEVGGTPGAIDMEREKILAAIRSFG